MDIRLLKHKPTGQVFVWQDHFSRDPDFVEVADIDGTPLPDALEGEFEVVTPAPKKSRTKKVAAVVEDFDDLNLDEAQAALDADASRGL